MQVKLKKYGESACLVRGSDPNWSAVLEAALVVAPPAGFSEYVCGYENLLLIFAHPIELNLVGQWLESLPPPAAARIRLGRNIEIPVYYQGPDLAEVAHRAGLDEAAVIAIHSAAKYTVRMMGFMPGFPYLDGLDPRLHLERRASPRNYIKPGAVAIGGVHAGIYSVGSPGGWHILGHTPYPLFRPDCAKGTNFEIEQIFALQPGDRIRFIALD